MWRIESPVGSAGRHAETRPLLCRRDELLNDVCSTTKVTSYADARGARSRAVSADTTCTL